MKKPTLSCQVSLGADALQHAHWPDVGSHDDYAAAVDLFQREGALSIASE